MVHAKADMMGRTRSGSRGGSRGQHDAGHDERGQCGPDPCGQACNMCLAGLTLLTCVLQRHPQGPDQGHRLCPGTQSPLLVTPMAQGAQPRRVATKEHPHPRWTVELVGTQGEEVHPEGLHVKGDMAWCLDGVRVERDATGVGWRPRRRVQTPHHRGDGSQILDGPHLIVHVHQRQQAMLTDRARLDDRLNVLRSYLTDGIHGQPEHRYATLCRDDLCRQVDGGVFRGGCDDEVPGVPPQYKVVALRAATGEDDVWPRRTDGGCGTLKAETTLHPAALRLQGRPGPPPQDVSVRWIAPPPIIVRWVGSENCG